ncbi:hypothetical protein TNCV_3968601 [Trichonephila clavipes]|nr:hypothetical protein TNCV_3968601 [Trichonephila clavipes]
MSGLESDGLGVVDQSLGPPRSPNLPSLDYLLMGHLRNLVYATLLDIDEDLVARISKATARVRGIPGIFERVRQ